MADVIASLRAMGILVLLDSPPLLPVTDALVLATRADATMLVCTAGRTTRKQARRAVELLRTINAPLAGVVLNAVPDAATYGMAYEYGPSEEHARRKSPPRASG
jgi:Mrp family chromosome partitioning ATPase